MNYFNGMDDFPTKLGKVIGDVFATVVIVCVIVLAIGPAFR